MANVVIPRLIFVFVLALSGCTPLAPTEPPPPTEPIHVHSYFAAYAFLDVNGDGQLDPADTPVEGATFIVTLPGGTEFGDQTDTTGYAFITIPASVEYPVTVRMEAPPDSSLKAMEPPSITLLQASGEAPQFLFQRSETQ